MPKKKIQLIWLAVIIGSILSPGTKGSENEAWKLKYDKRGIQVQTRHVLGSKYIMMRGQMQVKAGLNQLASLLRDPAACSEWADMCEQANIHLEVSKHESYVYSYHDVPWPLANRDVVNHVIWKQNLKTLNVTMSANAVESTIKAKKNTIRINRAKAFWLLKPMQAGVVELTIEAHVDPAGQLPSWFVNMMSVKSMHKTFTKIRTIMQKGAYRDGKAGFIERK